MNKGIITIATGPQKYIDMAISLGISLSLHSPETDTAIITDSDDERLASLYRHIIIPPSDMKSGFLIKTSLFELSPFDETIFIDSDCLAVGDCSAIFDDLANHDFAVFGPNVNTGFWFTDIEKLLKKIDRPTLPKFNSGFFYFRRSTVAENIFREAQDVFFKQDFYEIDSFKGSCPDEPCLAIGMAKYNIRALDDLQGARYSYTPIGLTGRMHVDAIKGTAQWTIQNVGSVSPLIVHFVSRIDCQEYRTECHRLSMYQAGGLRKEIMPITAFLMYWVIAFRRFAGTAYHRWFLRDR